MKFQHSFRTASFAAILLLAGIQLHGQPNGPASVPPGAVSPALTPLPMGRQTTLTSSLSSEIKPLPVLDAMQRVADWQLANPSKHKATEWTQGAGYAGLIALAGISGDAKYRHAMLAMGETNDWKPGPRKFHADDQCVGQTYAELYFLYREPRMIAALRERFDDILDHPSTAVGLGFGEPDKKAQELWSWCDALFMGPPTWVRLYAATGDDKYLNFAVTNGGEPRISCTIKKSIFISGTAHISKRPRPMVKKCSGVAATAG